MDCFFCNQTGSKLQPNKSVAPSFSGRDQLFTVSIIPHTKIFVQIYPEFLHPGGPLVARLCQPSTDFFPQCSRFPYCHPQPRGPLQDFANHPQISFPNAAGFLIVTLNPEDPCKILPTIHRFLSPMQAYFPKNLKYFLILQREHTGRVNILWS
jgi:hypothetical protein